MKPNSAEQWRQWKSVHTHKITQKDSLLEAKVKYEQNKTNKQTNRCIYWNVCSHCAVQWMSGKRHCAMKTVTHIKSTNERLVFLFIQPLATRRCSYLATFQCVFILSFECFFFLVSKNFSYIALAIHLKSRKFLHYSGQIVPILIDDLSLICVALFKRIEITTPCNISIFDFKLCFGMVTESFGINSSTKWTILNDQDKSSLKNKFLSFKRIILNVHVHQWPFIMSYVCQTSLICIENRPTNYIHIAYNIHISHEF